MTMTRNEKQETAYFDFPSTGSGGGSAQVALNEVKLETYKQQKNIFKNLAQQIFYLITLQKFKNNKYYG